MEQVLEQKHEVKEATSVKQRIALAAVQKQLQILKLKEILLLIGFTVGGGLLRVPMQIIPSAEPITFFAMLAGWLFGKYKGFLVGAGALYISNFFVMGGQGPWTPFQALGFGLAGFAGGFLREKSTVFEAIVVAIIGTLAFELVMQFSSAMYLPAGFLALFVSALPFMMTHLFTNTLFAAFLPKAKKFVHEKGGFDEKAICDELISKHSNKPYVARIFSGKARQ